MNYTYLFILIIKILKKYFFIKITYEYVSLLSYKQSYYYHNIVEQ
jgi:hypothetical protein